MPCGEYLWDHRNESLREWLVSEFILGATGLGNANVSGFYLDDGWANTSQAIQPWMPKEGFCDHSPVGGATEEDLYCTADMGLTQADTTAITDAWSATMTAVHAAIAGANGWSWQMFETAGTPGKAQCAEWFRGEGRLLNQTTLYFQYTNSTTYPLPAFEQDLATFLLVRGDFAWLGFGWMGCTSNSTPGFGTDAPYSFPSQLHSDFGTPVAPYDETAPGSGVFARQWTKAAVQFDCNTWTGSITPQ